MSPRREMVAFALALATLLGGFFHASLFGGKVLSPGDVLYASSSFAPAGPGDDYEPANRLLMDPVLQFEPWREFARSEIRSGRLPLWNPFAGCGSPLLANGQSAIFDPFQAIAYLFPLPAALSWISAARLWVAGFGMYLLAASWGYSRIGRWLSGAMYPLCGFLLVWLQYPVTSVAVWLPWLFLATDRAWDGPRSRGVAGLAIVVGCVLLGGHVQTSAHVLLAAGLYVAWRAVGRWAGSVPRVMSREPTAETREPGTRSREAGAGGWEASPGTEWSHPNIGASPSTLDSRLPSAGFVAPIARWSLGVALGITLAAIEILPLASYLTKSPVWSDRRAEKTSVLSVARPRVLDAMTTAMPYLFGSQRRGHPNLARAIGVHNLNEAAGGFAGLATLVLLAPMAWGARRDRPRVKFLATLAAVGAMGAFGVPPVANVLKAIPVLDVTDNRRLTLWVAFSLCLLAGEGSLGSASRRSGRAPGRRCSRPRCSSSWPRSR